MAIDGVKIIDSDDGYDIYNTIVERYKDGENIDTIIEDILNDEHNFCIDSFYTEIYWTAFAYSLWKVGHLPEEIKNKALEIIAKGADDFWLEIDGKALKQRQKELDKLAVQLQSDHQKSDRCFIVIYPEWKYITIHCIFVYSPAKAKTGSSFAALAAGFMPKKIPTKTENTNEIAHAPVLTIND